MSEVLAEVVRSGFVEGCHRGSIVALAADGSVDWAVGDVTSPILPRSSNKPVQALGMVRAGLDLPPHLLALACSSHSGEPFHLAAVREILAAVGLDESALHTPADYPLVEDVRDEAIRAGAHRAPIYMDCSGKHAGMLATSVANGWDTAAYLDPEGPLQQHLRSVFEELTGEPVGQTPIDGCGAPIFPTSLTGLTQAFRALSVATSGPEHSVAEAIRRHPEYVSGTTRDERELIRAVPGAIAKAGAECVYAVAVPDGRAWAMKVDDGSSRARPVLMTAALARSGVLDEPGVDADALHRIGTKTLLGGGRPVGEIRSLLLRR